MGKFLTLRLLAVGVLALALVACGDDDEAESTTGVAPSTAVSASTPGAVATSPGIVGGATGTSGPAAAATTAASTPAGPQAIEVKMGDYYFEPKDLTARPGAITFRLTNAGPERPHTLAVRRQSGGDPLAQSSRVEVNANGSVDVTLTEPGTYQILCTLPGHADRGQVGTLTIRS